MEEPRSSKLTKSLWPKVGKWDTTRKHTMSFQNQVVVKFLWPHDRFEIGPTQKSLNTNSKKIQKKSKKVQMRV
ncbi:hypothetical protein AYI68_g3406 [Smittium mucronatum]|uniref:Uncharacterized protein n=1 Tax=Smittium mucronatum TaxID=133383 RepID=A0A1R0GZZ6_9FUNG|nr:hypothetical protein AYI68_g3406 [Smittium mucronatum]